MSTWNGADPRQVAAALRKLADDLEAGKGPNRNLCIVTHTAPKYGPLGAIVDYEYLGETAVLTTRQIPDNYVSAVDRFFYDIYVWTYPKQSAQTLAEIRECLARWGGGRIELAAELHTDEHGFLSGKPVLRPVKFADPDFSKRLAAVREFKDRLPPEYVAEVEAEEVKRLAHEAGLGISDGAAAALAATTEIVDKADADSAAQSEFFKRSILAE
jgi:hypothetical protein